LPSGVLKSQSARLQSSEYDKTIAEYYGSQTGPKQRLKDRIVATARATPKETGIGTLQAFIEFRPQSYAAQFQGPALAIIQSQFDTPGALHRIGRFEHRAIDGVGHWLQLGAPDQFYGLLDEFLEQVANAPNLARRTEAGESSREAAPPHR
jgi:pimeloyl-ACP methyl ester carboxylesterase